MIMIQMQVKPGPDDLGGIRGNITRCQDKTEISFWKAILIHGKGIHSWIERNQLGRFEAWYQE